MKTAVIADDSPTVRRIARSILQNLGFVCHEAADGRETLVVCRDRKPELLLLDWEMPEMDGIGVMNVLRANAEGGPKVLFCSTHNDLEHIQMALEAGSDEYVMKPFTAEIIEDKLRNIGLVD